jgi:site-specific DNA recombinase
VTDTAAKPNALRCAIYTRKSSEEGLEQSFNSLHAQREASEAYIKSQAHEGWVCLAPMYDDGGFSGGSMDRPGLKRLLADIARREIDVVVVYKVDRLTRSLTDFSRIVDAFDAQGVSFVSVTQAFNTTTSMGRLTLNVLLSFAQFEREVTGERIRDKIAQSKAKGMWMGGSLPLGYDGGDHTLVVNPAEARQVKAIFERYLELGSVHALAEELEQSGARSKAWTSSAGRAMGGRVFSRGALYHLLSNRHYLGLICHKEKTHPGRHPAIVDKALFEAVQKRLDEHRLDRRKTATRSASARLTGRVVGADGGVMTPSFAYGRGSRRYRYYIAAPLVRGRKLDADGAPGRIPGEAIEAFVHGVLRRLSGLPDADWATLSPALHQIQVRAEDAHLIVSAAALYRGEHEILGLEAVETRLLPGERALAEPSDEEDRLRIIVPIRMIFHGGRSWLIGADGRDAQAWPAAGATLLGALHQAHAIMAREGLGVGGDIRPGAMAPDSPYHRKLCRLALLAPDLQAMIFERRTPPTLTLQGFLDAGPPPILWQDQRRWFAAL